MLIPDPPYPFPALGLRRTFATGRVLLYESKEGGTRWDCFSTFATPSEALAVLSEAGSVPERGHAFLVDVGDSTPPPIVGTLVEPIERLTILVGDFYERNDAVERWQGILRAAPVVWCSWQAIEETDSAHTEG